MPVRTVLQLGDPVLREVCAPVADPASPEVAAVVVDLAETLAHWRAATGYGRGIAAPQIGVLRRIAFLQLPGRSPWPLVNPEIVERSTAKRVVWDGCLSFLSVFFQVERHREIALRYQDLTGATHALRAGDEDDLAELLQHEIDHLDGILAIDRIVDLKSLVTREEFEKRFRADSPYGR